MSHTPPVEREPQLLKGKRISNYEGFKRLDQMLEGVATGRLHTPDKSQREPVRDIYCPLCHFRKRSMVFVRSEILGTRMPSLPFRVEAKNKYPEWAGVPKGIIVCRECAEPLQGRNR